MQTADTLKVREMEARDAAAVAPLIVQLGYERPVAGVLAWIARVQADAQPREVAFVACLGEEVVGWIQVSLVYHLQSAPFGLIDGLVVKDGVRGLGVGRLLCERGEQWSWEHGVDTVRVTSRSTREAAHRFYLRDGYREVKRSHVFEKTRQPDAPEAVERL